MKANEHAKLIADSMGLTRANTVITSSEKRIGKEELLERIERAIAVANENGINGINGESGADGARGE